MIETHIYFDSRRLDKQGQGCLKLVLSKNNKRAMISLGIKLRPNQWDGKVINHSNKVMLNALINAKKADSDRALIELRTSGIITGKTPKEITQILAEYLDPTLREERLAKEKAEEFQRQNFIIYFKSHKDNMQNPGTRDLYRWTFDTIVRFIKFKKGNSEHLAFKDISVQWLEDFERFCLMTEKRNSAAIHLRNIRAVINKAIDENLTINYPFRKFKIKTEETLDKSYTSEELRKLFNCKSSIPGEQEAIDIFKLMFCLIGINSADLANLVDIKNGRVSYYRRKTNKLYNLKIQPEAQEIINRYKGKDFLLNILERCPNYKTYFHRIGKNLKKLGKVYIPGKGSIGTALFPEICTGSARTSWATIAQEELDIPREIIAAALGHHTIDVTSTYLRTDWRKKVDEANRKVLDLVFYGKK